ncbi:unnamed protein product [Rhizophagus irregularis]|nr:unnamed protein product [Rhizophagus irregularis]
MNSQKKLNSAPKFSWPQLRSTDASLEVGSLGGCSYIRSTPQSIYWSYMNEAQTYHEGFDIEQITNVTQLFPHTRRHYPIPQYSYSVAKAYYAQSAQFLSDSYPEFDIFPEYIVDTLFEESYNESKNFDPYMSHELITIGNYEFSPGIIKKFISFPIGISGTELNFIPLFNENNYQDSDYNSNQHKSGLNTMSTLNFKTPIRQVTSSIYEHTPDKNLDTYNYCPSLMAVRTISGTTFLKVIVPELEDAQDYLKAVAAIVDGNGSIHLWKGERHEDYSKLFIKYDFKTIRTSQVEVDLSPKDLWKTCEYGAHPQTLLVASRISADLFDFRSRDVTLIYDTNNEDKIFSFQRSPVYNAFEFILTTQNNVMLLDQRFPKRPMLMWPHHHSSPPCGVNITMNEKISIVLTWSKSPPTITAFQYLTSASGPVTSTCQPVSIPSFNKHPSYSRSKYMRSPYTIRDENQQQKLPSLSSVLLSNDFTPKKADNNLNSCFNIFQLSQTGALYSQAFHAKDKTDITIRPSIPSNRFNLQIIEMSDSIASLHSLADMDVGTMPELRVKQSQNWHFEKIWDYISKDFKCISLNNISPFVLKTGTLFISWEIVENFFEHYGHVVGFNCQKKSIVKDVNGNIQSLTYACMEGKFFNKKNNKHKKIVPCEWKITISYIKSDKYIIVTKFLNQHNHELFSSLYNSEWWRSHVIDNTNMKAISNNQIINQNNNEREIFMNSDLLQENQDISFVSFLKKVYKDNLWILDNIGHPLTLYEILKNIPGSHINDLEVPRVQQFSETPKIKKDLLELSVEWSLFDVNFLFEQLLNSDFNSAPTTSQIFEFSNINITDKCPADIEKELNCYLRKVYPLSADNNESGEINNIPNLNKIKYSRQYAIEVVSKDLVKSLQTFISKSRNCPKFSLSSDILSEQQPINNNSTNSDCFTIKCKKSINNADTENNGYVMTTAAQELSDDWIIGQDLKEYDYKFLDDFENITNEALTNPTYKLEENQIEVHNIEKENPNPIIENINKDIVVENITEDNVINQNTSNIIEKPKPKKKSRKSGFR